VSEPGARRYAFGDFHIDGGSRQLHRRDGTPVPLTPKVFQTLLLLVESDGRLLGKDTLIEALWPHRVVEENNLTQNISTLRRVLGDGAGGRRYILTEPGRGYRFVEPVRPDDGGRVVDAAAATSSAAARPATASPRSPARWPRRPWTIAAVLVALALAAGGWLLWHARVLPSSVPSLAVLPFKSLPGDALDDVLPLGMADTLITKLSSNPHVVVRSLSAVRDFGQPGQDPVTAGRALRVASVLEGHIQRHGLRIRINARLLAVPSGAALWTGTFDAPAGDVFETQDAMARQVASALSLRLDRSERQRMERHYTRNVAAYQWYLKGRVHMQNATPPELVAAIGDFQRALAVDPDYALAYVGLAESYRRQAIISDADPQIVLPRARIAALHALQIDDTLAEAYVPLGFVNFWYDWDWSKAEASFRRGIELQPNSADLHFGYAALLSNLGRNDDALRESQRARELDPTSALYVALESSFVAYAGHPDEARQQIEGVLRARPRFWIAHLALGWLDADANRYREAADDFRKASALSGGSQQAVSMLGFALARAGEPGQARALLASLRQRERQAYLPPTSIATIYCGLGDDQQALTWLERGYAARDVRMTFLRVDRRWDALRGDPRFARLLGKMRL
jgi:DNA-binding winged helix-turn-helix (wHTH) protein/TolB-like protein/Flp pilus assembly protein TadD